MRPWRRKELLGHLDPGKVSIQTCPPGFEASVWYGVIGPAGVPAAVVSLLHGLVQKALSAPEVRDRLVGAGGEVQPGPTERLTSLIASERERYARLIREASIKPD